MCVFFIFFTPTIPLFTPQIPPQSIIKILW